MVKKRFLLVKLTLRARQLLVCLFFLFLGLPATAKKTVRGDSIFVEIYSMADWKQYAKEYGQTFYHHKYGTIFDKDKVYKYDAVGDTLVPYYLDVKLFCDLSFDNSSTPWQYFNGHFDGQGHTFNVNFKDDEKNKYYVFRRIGGTIENVKIQGRVEYRYGLFSYTENIPLLPEPPLKSP